MTNADAPVRLGLVGCGRVAETRHLPALARVAGARVVAASDVDPARLDSLARRFGVAKTYTDFRALIADADVEAVAVCVPPRLHAEVSLAALDAGKHLFVEKPLALSLEDCDLLVERARAAGVRAAVGFNLRHHRLVRRARESVRRGDLGRVQLLRTVFTTPAHDDPSSWRSRRADGGGVLLDLGVHHFDLLRFLLEDEPEEVSASGDDASCVFTARTARGRLVSSVFREGTSESHELELYGERGRLRVSCYRFDGFERTNGHAGSARERLTGGARLLRELPSAFLRARRGGDVMDSYAREWQQFARAVRHGGDAGATLEDGRRALAIALEADVRCRMSDVS